MSCRMWRYSERWSWASWKEDRTSTRLCASSLVSTAMRSSQASPWPVSDRYDVKTWCRICVVLSTFSALEKKSTFTVYCSEHLRVWTLIFCVVCSEKSSGYSLGRGAERTGAADDERCGQSKSGLSTQLPCPQHVQWGPWGHLHQGVRCQTLAGKRSEVILCLFIIETGKSSVLAKCCLLSCLFLVSPIPPDCL